MSVHQLLNGHISPTNSNGHLGTHSPPSDLNIQRPHPRSFSTFLQHPFHRSSFSLLGKSNQWQKPREKKAWCEIVLVVYQRQKKRRAICIKEGLCMVLWFFGQQITFTSFSCTFEGFGELGWVSEGFWVVEGFERY